MSLEYEATRAVRYQHPLTCVVVRVTNFDEVIGASEETAAGLLLQLANGAHHAVRSTDPFFRSDRDELTLLLPETNLESASVVVGRLRSAARDAKNAVEPRPRIELGCASIEVGGSIT